MLEHINHNQIAKMLIEQIREYDKAQAVALEIQKILRKLLQDFIDNNGAPITSLIWLKGQPLQALGIMIPIEVLDQLFSIPPIEG